MRVVIQVGGRCLLAVLLTVFSSLSLSAHSREIHLDQHPWLEPIWALNVGGSHYQSVHGITFQADDCEVAEWGPIDPSIFPQSLEIDYVRVYEVAPAASEVTN